MSTFHCQIKAPKQKSAKKHADYIECEGRYKSKIEELEHPPESGNMPEWAKDNPKEFWKAADEFERANGQTYKEIEVALPRELTPDQRQELVREFVEKELSGHAYTWGIHNKKASDGEEQPHAHIMFSPRQNDKIERSREQYFKRANSKEPGKGGCKKSDRWAGSLAVQAKNVEKVRERWGKAVNHAYEKANLSDRVDHRSLADQGIDRIPQVHRGPVVQEMGNRLEDTRKHNQNRSIKALNQSRQLSKQINQLYTESKTLWGEEKQLRDAAWNLKREQWKAQQKHRNKQRRRGIVTSIIAGLVQMHQNKRMTERLETMNNKIVELQTARLLNKQEIARLAQVQAEVKILSAPMSGTNAPTTALNKNQSTTQQPPLQPLPAVPVFTPDELIRHEALRRIDAINQKMQNYFSRHTSGKLDNEWFNKLTDQLDLDLEAIAKKNPDMRIKMLYDGTPITVNGVSISNLVAKLPPVEKPEPVIKPERKGPTR